MTTTLMQQTRPDKFLLMFGYEFTRDEANEALAQLYAGVTEGIYFEWRE